MEHGEVTVHPGRTVAFTDLGDPDGVCVLFFHGAPASRLVPGFLADDFAAEGLRVLSLDRPGYGGSSPQPGRSRPDWPDDVAAVAAALGGGRFAVIGHSSGGPYALACCALLPDQVVGGLVVASPTDMRWPRARDGWPPLEVEVMELGDEEAAVAWLTDRVGADGSGLFDDDPFVWPAPDLALFADDEYPRFVAALDGDGERALDSLVRRLRQWGYRDRDVVGPGGQVGEAVVPVRVGGRGRMAG
jgi:pimeloyl-ACP methyl ester carboxylesterase